VTWSPPRLSVDERARLGPVPLWRPFAQLAFNLSLYTIACGLAWRLASWPASVVLFVIQAWVLSGTFIIGHDASHGTFAPRAWINRVAGTVVWALTFMNATDYKYFHRRHHAFTGTENDTEGHVRQVKTYGDYVRLCFRNALFFDAAGWRALFLRRFSPYVPASARRAVIIDQLVVCAWVLALMVMLWFWPRIVLRVYLGPWLLAPLIGSMIGMLEHHGTDWTSDLGANTRSVSTNLLVRTVLWNANYHAEHHAFPTVPSYRLHELASAHGAAFKYRERSYVAFHVRTLSRLRLR
jgi:fatty acid desaturase